MEGNFIKPRYDEGGFASLPGRVSSLLAGKEKYDALILFLIDGFGWRFFEKFQDAPFLKDIASQGRVEKLTAQFPSTTAAALTTLHSGMPVGEHGVFEWIYYEPTLDTVIAPLLFSLSGTGERDTLKSMGAKAKRLLPTTTHYHALQKQGVASTVFQHREYTPGTYSNVVMDGAVVRGYRDLPEALVTLASQVKKSNPPSYFVLYYEKIDSVSHDHGPVSPQTEAEIQIFLLTMEKIFQKEMAQSGKRVLCLLTADHGQVETDPLTTLYLNRQAEFLGVEKFLRKNNKEELIVPAGSARDFFLYIQPGLMEEAQAFLSTRLAGRAEVFKVADLMQQGYFGAQLSPKFCARAGDLVILPYAGESVWWYEKDRFEQRFRGHHGGLTPQEMEIPLLSWEM